MTRRRGWGLGLVECMVSLVVASVLLTACAAAFRGSADAIQINDDFFRASQAGRVALARILTQSRRGTVDTASTSTSLHMITDGGQDITYIYDSSAKQVKLITNASITDPDYVLVDNVTQCAFTIDLGTDYNNAQCVARVAMQITVQVGENSVFLTDSAAPRRSLTY